MAKEYVYKVFQDSEYQGTLRNVTSLFNFSQAINTAGSQLEVELGSLFDDAGPSVSVEELVTEAGEELVTETGESILASKAYTFGTIPIRLGNEIQVWMYDQNYPSGRQVFNGVVTAWKSNYASGNILLTVLSYGVQFDNYVLYTGISTNVEQTVYDAESDFGKKGVSGFSTAIAQTFQVTADTSISTVGFYVREGATTKNKKMKVSLVEGTPSSPGATLASVTKDITNASFAWTEFTFSTPVDVTSSTDYFILIANNNTRPSYENNPFVVRVNASSVYASGNLYTFSGTTWTSTSQDLCFIISSGTGETSVAFNSREPGSIIQSILDNFNGQGGVVTYDASSIADTGRTVSYTFVLNTALEGIQKCLELAPGNWYWYVDVGSNILYFQAKGSTPNHTFVQGKHLVDLDIENTVESVRNTVYFSGGDTGSGENLFLLSTNEASIESYGTWLERVSDNRVTLTDTAELLSSSVLETNQSPPFRTEITIPAAVYDIETISLGQMIGFAGFNDLINDLLLQVVSISRQPDAVSLSLDTVPPSVNHRIEDIKRNLDKQETINNPSSPN